LNIYYCKSELAFYSRKFLNGSSHKPYRLIKKHPLVVDDDDDDDEERINFSVALSPKTTRTRNNKLKQ